MFVTTECEHNFVNFQSGADINAKDMLKMTALHWAAQHGHHSVAETLIKHGADVHALSKFDKTPFDIAADTQNTELMLLLQVRQRRSVIVFFATFIFIVIAAKHFD